MESGNQNALNFPSSAFAFASITKVLKILSGHAAIETLVSSSISHRQHEAQHLFPFQAQVNAIMQ
jgi:hypothetical protein